uniref:Reverse transcriptase domain-containing protein n=3 Tax=Lygus hesperus TaxID=30085 RepID=A0A0K8TJE5_LYGHE
MHRLKKRIHDRKELENIELAHESRDVRKFYRHVNKKRKGFAPESSMCKDENGELLTDKQGVLRRWNRHFRQLLCTDQHSGAEPARSQDRHELCEPPTVGEVGRALSRLKNNKAAGDDSISAEMIKAGGDELVARLHTLILRIWENEEIPADWENGTICVIHKKGDPMECSNFRGITLLNVSYKILSNILFDRLLPHAQRVVGAYQRGFMPGKSTIDQIFSLRQIIEKSVEFQMSVHHLFIDFKAAYDSIRRDKLYAALREFEIPEKLCRMIETTMRRTICRVRIQGDLSEEFETTAGLRQGDALACLLFNIALERVVRLAGLSSRGNIFYKSTQLLAYADDINLMARTVRSLEEAFESLSQAAAEMGLQINMDKTKYMVSGPTPSSRLPDAITLGCSTFQRVEMFTYLGSTVHMANDSVVEINKRLLSANRCYFGLLPLFRSRTLSRKSKLTIYKTLLRPVQVYGAETWVMTKQSENRIRAFERKILRRILGPVCDHGSWRRRTNEEVYQQYDDIDVVHFAKLGRLRWAGHVARLPDDDPAKKLFEAQPFGSRGRGRPKQRWVDNVEEDVARTGCRDWRNTARDRVKWKAVLKEAKAHPGL